MADEECWDRVREVLFRLFPPDTVNSSLEALDFFLVIPIPMALNIRDLEVVASRLDWLRNEDRESPMLTFKDTLVLLTLFVLL